MMQEDAHAQVEANEAEYRRYTAMDYDELGALYATIGGILKRKKADAIEEVKQRIAALGIDIKELKGKANGKRAKAKPKYQNPENPDETWSGRGKPPKWMQDHIDAGNEKEQLAITA